MSRAKDMLAEMMKYKGLNYSQTADLLGERRQLCQQRMEMTDDVKAEMFFAMSEALGYEVTIRDLHILKASERFVERLKDQSGRWRGGLPKGLFYHELPGGYEVLDTRSGRVESLVFTDKEQMMEWVNVVVQPAAPLKKRKMA